MKSHQKIAMALITGVAIGVAAIQGLHAQAKPTAYVVVAIRSITDAEGLKTVAEKAPAIIAAAGGHPLVATNAITSLDGKPPQRFVLFALDSIGKAKAWYDMPAMKELTWLAWLVVTLAGPPATPACPSPAPSLGSLS